MYQPLPIVAYSDLPGQLASLQQDSYVYMPGVLSVSEVQELKRCIDEINPSADSNDYDFDPGDQTKSGAGSSHFKNAFNHHPALFACIDMQGVIEVAEAAMGKDCHLVGMSAWKSGLCDVDR